MKAISITMAAVLCLTVIISCTKKTGVILPVNAQSREIQFQLYTDKDFSKETNGIRFTASVKSGTSTLWDSAFAPMKIKDVPRYPNRIIIHKIIETTDTALLQVGFVYAIENVGYSWYWDTCMAGQTFKAVNFSFQ